MEIPAELEQRLREARRLWLFLDYDGTLADFAPTPDDIFPDPYVIDLLTRLVSHPQIRIAVISGRRLEHVRLLLPVPGLILAGTYGVELMTIEGEQINQVELEANRPVLIELKGRWADLINGREGFFLEDKGYSLALHARFADPTEASRVLSAAHDLINRANPSKQFRVLSGDRFLEIGPMLAHKGQTVSFLLERYHWPGALPIYIGDDDKDEEAFEVIKALGGIAILVSRISRPTAADCRLESPQAVHQLLEEIEKSF